MEEEACIRRDKAKRKKIGIKEGMFYGLVPHIPCVLFIVLTLLGVTFAGVFLKNFLLNRYAFFIMLGISFGLAGISSFFYLRSSSCCERKNKATYLLTLFGGVILVNLIMFYFIFPLAASNLSGKAIEQGDEILILKMEKLPCSGHASLVIDELSKVEGIKSVKFRMPNYFDVSYDKDECSESEILN